MQSNHILILRLSLSIVSGILISSCNRAGHTGRSTHTSFSDTNEAASILKFGVDTNTIVLHFGAPSVNIINSRTQEWDYFFKPFPLKGANSNLSVIGVIISLTNGHLMDWNCVLVGSSSINSEAPKPISAAGGSPIGNVNAPDIGMFVVSAVQVADSEPIDTKEFPHLGYVHKKSDLLISNLQNTFVQQISESNWTFTIQLTSNDASRFEAFTEENVSKQILIKICGEAVSASVVVAPIQNGSFLISCTNVYTMQLIRECLSKMKH